MKYVATLNNKKYEIEIEKNPDYQPLSHEQIAVPASNQVSGVMTVSDEGSELFQEVDGFAKVICPVRGSICDIQVAAGDAVTVGQALLLLEAMKMENEIVAPVNGTVTSVQVKKGDIVDRKDVLITIKL